MDSNYSANTSPNGAGSTASSAGGSGAGTGTQASGMGAGQATGSSVRDQLGKLKSDLDGLMSRASSLSDEELRKAHATLMARFSSLRYSARGIASEASRQLNRGMETTTEYVKEKPMQSVAVAIGAGVLLGMLLRRP